MDARSARSATMVAAPRKIDFWDDRDLRQLAAATEQDRERLRDAVRSGPVEDRVMAAVALARLHNEAAPDLLAIVMADRECHLHLVRNIAHVVPDSTRRRVRFEHEALITPWLLDLLDSEDDEVRHLAACMSGRLRVAATGPRLLRLAQSELREVWVGGERSCAPPFALVFAAQAWPGGEVSDEVRGWIDSQVVPPPGEHSGDHRPTEAVAELAAWGEPGSYEWALRWCGEELLAGRTQHTVDALLTRGRESIPLLENGVRQSLRDPAAGAALQALAVLDPDRAEQHARAGWRRFPVSAMHVLGERYRGTADPEVADLMARIADETVWPEDVLAKNLVKIGGPRAHEAAARAVDRVVARDSDGRGVQHLRSLVRTSASPQELAEQVARLGLAPSDVANEVAAELARAPEPTSAYSLLVAVLHRMRCLVEVAPESGSEPPAYDDLVVEFAEATGGAVRVADVELIEEEDGVLLTFAKDGYHRTWNVELDGDWFDLHVVHEVAGALRPEREDDEREFVLIDWCDPLYAFVDPDKLAQYCETHGIDYHRAL
ncbi:hypothetical protein [Allokutzneria sp. NRRL B-24872]|uniref:hypothetical protein n=1 Tax=Allokutzneria sp. NRRL B-24872 TaxID=1137961 RepID=UPI001177D471|nr:hypothetical protein [Allokutzneria sp. NRRL B-24872]